MNWTPVDVVVAMLVVIIGAMLICTLGYSMYTGQRLSSEGLELFGKLSTPLVGFIGVYIGSQLKR